MLNSDTVPVYDGCSRFQLSNYWERPYEGSVKKGSAVMLLFTIKKESLLKKAEAVKNMPP
jgi:hypothetical protein